MQNDHFPEAPSESFSGNLEELISLVLKSSEELMNYVNAIKENELDRTLTYKNSKGIQFTSSYSETILHCINHSTYHRGQIITMLRHLVKIIYFLPITLPIAEE